MSSYNKINIIFRTCDLVNAVHNAPRPFNLDKKTLIKICFKSLYNSLQGFNYKIIVLGDNLSIEMKSFFLEFDVEFIEGVYGNEKSILETIKIAQNISDNQWIYFCEDDYLHHPDCIKKIVNLIAIEDNIIPGKIKFNQLLRKRTLNIFSLNRFLKKPNLVIFPTDYPDRYSINYLEKSFIFISQNTHWRQVRDTTFTFLMNSNDVKKHKKILYKASKSANDRYLSNKLFGKSFFFTKLLCVSPMPSLSTHMHIQTMSPIVNWEELVNKLKVEISNL